MREILSNQPLHQIYNILVVSANLIKAVEFKISPHVFSRQSHRVPSVAPSTNDGDAESTYYQKRSVAAARDLLHLFIRIGLEFRRVMTKSPTAIDIHVGSRICMRRTTLGLSQGTLGDGLGITFQQVQKYEKGINRVGAGRLQHISELLDVPVSFFFEGNPGTSSDRALVGTTIVQLESRSKETISLAKAFLAIDDDGIRQRVLDLIKSLGDRKEKRVLLDAGPSPARPDDA